MVRKIARKSEVEQREENISFRKEKKKIGAPWKMNQEKGKGKY